MPEANYANALLIYGPLGIFVGLFVFGFIYSKATVVRERELTDRLVENNAKMATSLDRLSDTILRDKSDG